MVGVFDTSIVSLRRVQPPYLCIFFYLLNFLNFVWILFQYFQCDYLRKQQQYHNKSAEPTAQVRFDQSINCVVATRQTSVLLFCFSLINFHISAQILLRYAQYDYLHKYQQYSNTTPETTSEDRCTLSIHCVFVKDSHSILFYVSVYLFLFYLFFDIILIRPLRQSY